MLNKYPAWKNILILVVVVLGLVYSAPNLYPDDEALQISNENLNLNASDVAVITTALEAAEIDYFGENLTDQGLMLRFEGVDEQLRAKTVIEEALTDDFIVALNLAPTTPAWMQAIGAGKMNLGLDLQGGVHFLMEVDMDDALERRMEDNISNVRSILREERIRTRGIDLVSNTHLAVRFASSEDRSAARSILTDNFADLQFPEQRVPGQFCAGHAPDPGHGATDSARNPAGESHHVTQSGRCPGCGRTNRAAAGLGSNRR